MKYSRFRINICHIYFVDRHFVSSLNCTNWSKSCGTKIWKIIILTEALKWWFVSWVLSSYDLQRFLMLLLSSYSRAMDNNSNITKPLLKLGKNPSRNTKKGQKEWIIVFVYEIQQTQESTSCDRYWIFFSILQTCSFVYLVCTGLRISNEIAHICQLLYFTLTLFLPGNLIRKWDSSEYKSWYGVRA